MPDEIFTNNGLGLPTAYYTAGTLFADTGELVWAFKDPPRML